MSTRTILLLAAVTALVGWTAALAADPADPPKDMLHGKVVSVDADKGTLVVKPKEGENVTVTTDKDTKITVDGKDAKLADIKADMHVMVSPATGVAKTIKATTAMTGLHGTVVSVDADKNTLVVKPKEGANVNVTADKDTKVKVDGKEAKLGDVKADMVVEVMPATGVAKTIAAHTPKKK